MTTSSTLPPPTAPGDSSDRTDTRESVYHDRDVSSGRLRAIGGATGAGVLLASAGAVLAWRGFAGRSRHSDPEAARRSDTRRALGGDAGVRVEEAITVNASASELFEFWRNFSNLPRFMPHLEKVERLEGGRTRWHARGPGGYRVSWEAEIINEVPDRLIAWQSIGKSDVSTAGSVHFDDAGESRGTRVRVHLQYSPPGGKAGAAVAKLFGRDAATQIREDLRKFKQLLEAGEIATTEGQPRG